MKSSSILVVALAFTLGASAQSGTSAKKEEPKKMETKPAPHSRSEGMENKSDVSKENQSEHATHMKVQKHSGAKKVHVKPAEKKEASAAPAENAPAELKK